MHPFIRLFVRLALICAVVYIAIQPYNWFCKLSSKCRPFYWYNMFPKQEVGEPFDVFFEVRNFNEDISFEPDASVMQTVYNRRSSMVFYAKNSSPSKEITFKPELTIEPVNLKKYVKTFDCPCSKTYTLKPGENIRINMEFSYDSDAMKANNMYGDDKTKPQNKIRYEIKIAK